MKGIDISNNNGSIDFLKVKNTGIEVVIIKATEGVDWIDPYLEKHYNGACGKGFSIGFYHFMSEKTNPSKQAEDFYKAIKEKFSQSHYSFAVAGGYCFTGSSVPS